MPIIVHPDGTVEASTVEELAELYKRMPALMPRIDGRVASTPVVATPRVGSDLSKDERDARIIRFLDLIHNGGSQGVLASKVEAELGLAQGGLGMMGTSVRYALIPFDIPKDDVYKLVEKGRDKYLVGRRRLTEAITKLTAKGGE